MIEAMKNITSSLTGLASSLFLNVGLTQMAQKLDPVSAVKTEANRSGLSAEICTHVCSFTKDKGL